MHSSTAAIVIALLAGAAFASRGLAENPAEIRLAPGERSDLRLTVYGNGLALVSDTRSADLATTPERFVFDGVSRRMIPSSALVSAAAGLRVHAMEYDTNVLTAAALLQRSLGATVGVVRTHPTTGEDSVEDAEVLSVDGGVVLRYRDRIETGVPGRLVFPAVPGDLRAQPALIATLAADAAAPQPLTLTYLSEGLSWSADYAIVLNDAAMTLRIDGRATIVNESGIDYDDASVALIAGEVNRAGIATRGVRMDAAVSAMREAAPMAAPPPERETFGDLHLYHLPRTVTLADGKSRQIALTGADGVPFERRYVSESGVNVFGAAVGQTLPDHPVVRLRFVNAAETGGGEPWPDGLARIYAPDAGGTLRLLGEGLLARTPRGERAELTPGRAFDITVRRTQTDFVRSGLGEGVFESAYRIEVRNAKEEAVSVDVVERLPGDWRILEASAPHQKEQAAEARWTVDVAPGAVETITYRVRVTTR